MSATQAPATPSPSTQRPAILRPGDWNAATRLGAFAVAAIVVFGAAFGIASAVAPGGPAAPPQPGTHDAPSH
ncbi:hypothetical protein AOA12_01620 [Microbacterium sp. No. 7]|nr:hypothetical protein AOA12_01620 [Microbacterium sp. No. 7]